MEPIIEIKDLGKKFKISHQQKPYLSLRDSIFTILKNPTAIFESKEDFWAIKNINLNIGYGESIGIIGKNGAGKSTLLKILSKITPPTTGKIILRGRVASLLEVGTGFHPELTGRENVFFNGAVLGMKRHEIKKKFDDIVSFSGVEKFIDTPLKHYSSGMQLRLAFAVAAFLESEILVVDEVLAVGDSEFQKRCLGKMEEVTQKQGRTVLFVSHNMGQISKLCPKSILLEDGELRAFEKTSEVIHHYLSHNFQRDKSVFEIENLQSYQEACVSKIEVTDVQNNLKQNFKIGEKYKLRVHLELLHDISSFVVGIGFVSEMGIPLRSIWTTPQDYKKGKYIFEFEEKDVCYGKGIYNLTIGLSSHLNAIFYKEQAGYIVFSDESILPYVLNSGAVFIIANTLSYKYEKVD